MTIKIQKGSVSFDQLTDYLMKQFPKYRFWKVGDNKLKIAKNRFFAAYVTVTKNKIIIKGGFTSFRLYVGFILFLLLFGIIVPVIVSYVVVYPKLQMFLQQIIDEVYVFYRHTVLNYSQFGRGDHK